MTEIRTWCDRGMLFNVIKVLVGDNWIEMYCDKDKCPKKEGCKLDPAKTIYLKQCKGDHHD